jgi:hypothetical protein
MDLFIRGYIVPIVPGCQLRGHQIIAPCLIMLLVTALKATGAAD